MTAEDQSRAQRAAREHAGTIADLERRLRALETQSSLARSSIHDGALTAYNDGLLRLRVGQQYDDTNTVNVVNGPVPPTPTQPTGIPGLRSARVVWDGMFEPVTVGDTTIAPVAPLDFTRVEIHASTDPGFTAESADTLVGTYETPRGGEHLIPLPTTEEDYTIKLVARTQSGNRSPASAGATVAAVEPDGAPTVEPEDSPSIVVHGTVDTFLVHCVPEPGETLDPTTNIQYHISETPGFTPSADTLALGGPIPSFVGAITRMPDGTPLQVYLPDDDDPETPPVKKPYYFQVIAENIIGESPTPSAEVEQVLDPETASTAAVATLIAGFAMVGAIQIGSNIEISPQQGIKITLSYLDEFDIPRSGVIQFPADGSPATITAELNALALNVSNMRVIGTANEVTTNASVELAEGVSNPVQKPNVTYGWPAVTIAGGADILLDRRIGDELSATEVVAIAKYQLSGGDIEIRLEKIHPETGVVTTINSLFGWDPILTDASMDLGGLTRAPGGNYFVLLLDMPEGLAASGTWTIYEFTTAAVFIGPHPVFTYASIGNATPAIFAEDATHISVVYARTPIGLLTVKRYVIPAWTSVSTECLNMLGGYTTRYIRAAFKHPSANILLVNWDSGNPLSSQWFQAFTMQSYATPSTAWVRNQDYEYQIASSAADSSKIAYGGATPNYSVGANKSVLHHYKGRWRVLPASPRVSLNDEFTYVWASASQTTMAANLQTLTYPNRAVPIITAPPPPEGDPDRIKVYARDVAGVVTYDRWDPAPGLYTVTGRQDTIAATGQALPGSNTFTGATPAILFSEADDAFGAIIQLHGDGHGRLGDFYWDAAGQATQPLGIPGELKMIAGATVPTGWVLCDGTAVSRTAFPYDRLYSVIGTTYGPGDGVNTYNLPNFTGKVPRGNTRLATGGTDTLPDHLHQVPAHAHQLDDAGSSGVPSGTGGGQRLTGGSTSPKTAFNTTNPNTNPSIVPSHVGVQFIIKL